jgi:hypothetical protein
MPFVDDGKSELSQGNRGSPVATDLPALFEHAMTLSDELGRAWSEALGAIDNVDAGEDLRVRWAVALQGLTAAVSAREKRYVAEGVDVRLDHWPPTEEEVAGLDPDPAETEFGRSQLELAQILAIELLVKDMGSFAEAISESAEGSGEGQLWEAGAFSRIRDRADLTLRITRELHGVDAAKFHEATPNRMEVARARAFEALASAQKALRRSDPDAALFHCLRAIRARIASLLVDGPDALDLTATARLDIGAALPAKMMGLAEEIVAREMAGRPVNSGLPLLLAHALVPATERLVETPRVEELLAAARSLGAQGGDRS